MQAAYYQEAMGLKSLKMQTLSRCNRRTKLHWPANTPVRNGAVQCSQWKFAYFRDSSLLGTNVALMQGEYYQEAMGMKSFKM